MSRLATASSMMLNAGQEVLVWRENFGWLGPNILSREDGKAAYVHDKAGEPRPFSVSKVKLFVTPGRTLAINYIKNITWF
jgi:hypothetical protein